LQPVDVPFDRATTPGQRAAGFDGGIVALETLREAPQHGQRARRRLLQPRIELLRLPGTEELREALGKYHDLRKDGVRLLQLVEHRLVLRCQVIRPTQHQPRRLARREALSCGIADRGPRLPCARPWGQSRGLAELGEITEYGRPSAPIALLLHLLIESHP